MVRNWHNVSWLVGLRRLERGVVLFIVDAAAAGEVYLEAFC